MPSRSTDPPQALKTMLDDARKAYLDTLQACDRAVRRGDDSALDALQRDAANRFAVLEQLAQQWLLRAARHTLWTMPDLAAHPSTKQPPHQ